MTLWHDLRYAVRTLRRSPIFTTVTVLSLALGIGANTAIFSLIDTLILRRLPVRDPARLVEFLQKYPGEPRGNGYFSFTSYEHYRDHNHVFSELIASGGPARVNLRAGGFEPVSVNGEFVVGSYFPVLGIRPSIGRLIAPGDEPGAPVAVVSWTLWKNRYHLDPAVIGRQLVVQDAPVTIIGVAPREFSGLQAGAPTSVWLPRPAVPRGSFNLLAYLRPGVTLDQARAEMTVLFGFTIDERFRNSRNPVVRQMKIEVEPAGAGLSRLRDRFATPLLVLMAVTGLLLLIACTNIASMMLARGASRAREMAVRVSLGAGRLQLVRQVLTESLLLSAAGSAIGILLASSGAAALIRMLTSGRPMIGLPDHLDIDTSPNARMLFITAAIAILTAVLFGLAPAWNAFTTAPAGSLRESSGGETRLRRLFGKSLVVAQVALSVVLLSAAGLFLGHLSNLQHLDLGFRRDHILLATIDPAGRGLSRERLATLYQELLPRLEAIPGVRSVSIAGATPISGAGASRFATIEGHVERPEDRRYLSLNWVAPKYFATLGTPLLAGRDFTLQDQSSPRVAIVNQAMARYYFAGASPIGKHITLDGDDKPYEIIGLAGDAKYYEIREPTPRTVYFNMFQEARVGSNFVLRTAVDPASVSGAVRAAVHDVLKTVPVSRVTTMTGQIDASIVQERLIASLSGLFGALGGFLAALGLYGLLAFTVARRIKEIGIRMALGATARDATRMVLVDGLGMVCAGLLAGAPIALWAKRLAVSRIPDLPASSLVPIASGAAAMLLIALVAAYIPARRAAAVDPIAALRHE